MTEKLLQKRFFLRFIYFLLNLGLLLIFIAFIPLEKTLGNNLRLVYLHGAWVWTALIGFALAALFGMAALIKKRQWLFHSSNALGRTSLLFWVTYLPMSLWVMQANWGGFYFDEPRWRVPMIYAIVGILLQVGLWLMQTPLITAAANVLYGAALWWSMANLHSVLHPDSPVMQSGSLRIQLFFGGLLFLMLYLGYQVFSVFWAIQSHNPAPNPGGDHAP